MKKYHELENAIRSHKRIVFFGGAGVSTESGLPDYRGIDGIDNQGKDADGFYAEERRTREFMLNYPELFYSDMVETSQYNDADPNACHLKLAELEESGRLKAVITQNIDGLHQKAGSQNVIELHGNANEFYCDDCKKKYSMNDYFGKKRCSCGGMIRPNIVLFGEEIHNYDEAVKIISKADMLIVAGTSLTVYPASLLIDYFVGDCLVLIDRQKTPRDGGADILIRDSVAKVFEGIDV